MREWLPSCPIVVKGESVESVRIERMVMGCYDRAPLLGFLWGRISWHSIPCSAQPIGSGTGEGEHSAP